MQGPTAVHEGGFGEGEEDVMVGDYSYPLLGPCRQPTAESSQPRLELRTGVGEVGVGLVAPVLRHVRPVHRRPMGELGFDLEGKVRNVNAPTIK